jgi:putative protein-disulfide isomerase
MAKEHEIMYFTDPMCSWCYGFGPEIERLRDAFSQRMPLQMVLGGLRPDETRALSTRVASEIAGHWEHVQAASGREFDFEFFEKHPEFVYNTGPACRAVIAAGRMDPPRSMEFQHALQELYYARGEDPTDPLVFERAAEIVGLDPARFREVFEAEETGEILQQNFALARAFGINGYPSVVLHEREADEEKFILVSRGYMPFADLARRLEMILNDEVKLVPGDS